MKNTFLLSQAYGSDGQEGWGRERVSLAGMQNWPEPNMSRDYAEFLLALILPYNER
jgi:hypothetical protein